MSTREVLYELVHAGLTAIRSVSGGSEAMSPTDRQFVHAVSSLLYELPSRLARASTDQHYEELLRDLWRDRRGSDMNWFERHLDRLGIDPEVLTRDDPGARGGPT